MGLFFQKLASDISPDKKTAAIILAAGNSTRMGNLGSKQLLTVGNVPVLALTLQAYEACPCIQDIIVVGKHDDFDLIAEWKEIYQISKLSRLVEGGRTRQESAKIGYGLVDSDVRYVAIADGARCLITPEEITNVCVKAYSTNAASAACPIFGTIKKTDCKGNVISTVPREDMWEAQTPQVFHLSLYAAATELAESDGFACTDDNSLIEHFGCNVSLVPCSRENIKITTPEDLQLARAIYCYRKAQERIRQEGSDDE